MRQHFQEYYADRVRSFAAEVGDINAKGIPEVHLPLWGRHYETTLLKIAFVGRDTRYWGCMEDFLKAAKDNPEAVVFRNEAEFLDLPFTGWTNNFGTSFWDTVMQFLALFHGVQDWRQLKRRQRDDILHTFVWAETNAVELWGSTPSMEGADFQAWRKLKSASERYFDSFAAILSIFKPNLAIIMNWTVPDSYWDCPLQFQSIGDHVEYALAASHDTHVFKIAHPNWLRGDRREATLHAVLNHWHTVRIDLTPEK